MNPSRGLALAAAGLDFGEVASALHSTASAPGS